MRINGITPAPAYRSGVRRSESGTVPADYRERFRFSLQDVIIELSQDAIEQTGRRDLAPARRRHMPPENYDRSGALVYYAPPLERLAIEPVAEAPPEPEESEAPRVSYVSFDGMLRPRPISQGAPRQSS